MENLNGQNRCQDFLIAAGKLHISPEDGTKWIVFEADLQTLKTADMISACRALLLCFGFHFFCNDDENHQKARTMALSSFIDLAKKDPDKVWTGILQFKFTPEYWRTITNSWERQNLLEALLALRNTFSELLRPTIEERLATVIALERTENLPGKVFVERFLNNNL